MELNDDFFAILPSDSNLDIFPQNKPSKYCVQFRKSLDFEREQVCCLYDIILPPFTPSLKKTVIKYVYAKNHYASGSEWNLDDHVLHEYHLDLDMILDRNDILTKLEEVLRSKPISERYLIDKMIEFGEIVTTDRKKFHIYRGSAFQLSYNKSKDGDFLTWQNNQLYDERVGGAHPFCLFLLFDNVLTNLFDIPDIPTVFKIKNNKLDINKSIKQYIGSWVNLKFKSPVPKFDESILKRSFDIFILCDIVTETFVDIIKQQFLRKIHCKYTGDVIQIIDPLIYIPVNKMSIYQINISVVSSDFQPVFFQNGTTVVILHFKNKK